MNALLTITTNEQGLPVVSTLDFAEGLDIQHASLIKTVRDYQESIEKDFGPLRFEIDADYQSVTGIVRMSHAYLTEDQALFVGSLSRNSERVVEFKSVLVQSFQAARRSLQPALPQNYKEALQALLVKVEENEQLQAERALLKPKADYADAVLSSQSELTTTTIAKEVGMSPQKLNAELKKLGVQYTKSGIWYLYRQYDGKGYANLRTHIYGKSPETMRTKHYLVWTEKGRQFIHDLIGSNKRAPLQIEEK